MATINKGWLKNNKGEKFAPKTLSSQVMTSDGITLENKIQEEFDNLKEQTTGITEEQIAQIETNKTNIENLSKEIVDYTEMICDGESVIRNPVLVNKAVNNGEVTTSTSTRATNEQLIYIPKNSKLSVSVKSGFKCGVFGFDSDKTYNYHVYVASGLKEIVENKDSRFVRLLIYKVDDTENISIEEATNAITLTLFVDKNLSDIPDPDDFVKAELGKNLFDKSKVTNGYIASNSGGISAHNSYSVSDYIFVPNGKSIVISPKIRHFIAYDSSKTSIKDSYVSTSTDNLVYTASQDVYVRFDFYTSQLDVQQAEYGVTPTSYEAYGKKFEDGIHLSNTMAKEIAELSILSEKVIMSFGDSIMAGDGNGGVGIADILGNRHNMTVKDFSLGGATITYVSDVSTARKNITSQVTEAISSVTDAPDYIIFDGLTNDINGGAVQQLGEVAEGYDSEFDNTTFCGAFEQIVRALKTSYPSSKLVYVHVHHMSSRNLSNQNTFGDKAEEICRKWGVPIADIYHSGGLNTFLDEMHKYTSATSSQPTGDRTHPTQEGYDLFYIPIIESVLKSIS